MPNTQVATQDPHVVDVEQEQTVSEHKAPDPDRGLEEIRDSNPAAAAILNLFDELRAMPNQKLDRTPNPRFDAEEAALTWDSPLTGTWHPGKYTRMGESEAA